MINPIPKSSFFATPASLENLQAMLNGVGDSNEQRLAWLGAMMALNLAHNLVEEQLAETV